MTEQPPKTWQERFDDEFPTDFNRFPNPGEGIEDQQYIEISNYAHSRPRLKSFIAKEIEEAKKEGMRDILKHLLMFKTITIPRSDIVSYGKYLGIDLTDK